MRPSACRIPAGHPWVSSARVRVAPAARQVQRCAPRPMRGPHRRPVRREGRGEAGRLAATLVLPVARGSPPAAQNEITSLSVGGGMVVAPVAGPEPVSPA